MELTTNIVLEGDRGRTQSYMIQLIPGSTQTSNFIFDENVGLDNRAILYNFNSNHQLIKYGNDWRVEYLNVPTQEFHKSTIRLYFPQYSVDTFDKGTIYILSISTYIHGTMVDLGEFEVKRKDSLACAPIRFSGMDEYYEYMDFVIADPYSLHFNNEGKSIRESLGDLHDTDNNSSLLYVCLSVVEKTEDGYVLKNNWGSGQNSLALGKPQDMSLSIKYDSENRTINMSIDYPGKPQKSFNEYITETYNVEYVVAVWEYVIMDEENIYFSNRSIDYIVSDSFDASFDFSFGVADGTSNEGLLSIEDVFKSWDSWKNGLYIYGSVSFINILDPEKDYDIDDNIPFITIFSNRLPITQELFSMLINGDSFPSKIDLDSLSMNNINLVAINNINQEINVVESPYDSSKNHMIQPVFYQTRDMGHINIHPQVTENISINLDSYKSRVKSFMIQIEGVSFAEIGRTNKGVVFKIIGSMLPKNVNNGTAYILDQDSVLVTTGKYIYIY